jgi:hypothetical protein
MSDSRLNQLREILGQHSPAVSRERFAFSLERDGIPRGAITEISGSPGSGKSEAVFKLISETSSSIRVAWVEEDFTIYPCALLQAGVDLSRVLFSQAGGLACWSAQQILRSQLFPIVVLSARIREEIELRRLQLAAEKSCTTLLLLSDEPRRQGAWPIRLQLEASRDLLTRECRLNRLNAHDAYPAKQAR